MAMKSIRGLSMYLFVVILMIINTVKGRWLGISDGVHDEKISSVEPSFLRMSTTLSDSKRCESVYGFLPCADTVPESIFLIVMYTYALMCGEDWLRKGSAALLIHFKNQSLAGSVFRLLMALPRVVMVIVSGALSTQSDARNQVAFGVAMYAGSTVISLTGIWGVNVILNKEKLNNRDQSKTSKYSSSRLSFLKDDGVRINEGTRDMALIMLLSLIPFAVVLLLQVFSNRMMILFALIVSALAFCSYIAYQITHPQIQAKSVAYLKEDDFQQLFLMKLQMLTSESLFIDGQPNKEAFKSIFNIPDVDESGHLSMEELKKFIIQKLDDEDDEISRDYALEEIVRHFDKDADEKITMKEFEAGCTNWLSKWNVSDHDINGVPSSHTIYNKFVVDNKIEEYSVMPKTLFQPLIKNLTGKENGEVGEKQIEELFRKYDVDKDGEMNYEELEKAIATLNISKQDPGAFAKSMINELDIDKSGKINRKEVISGLKKWTKMAKDHASTSNDLATYIRRFAVEALGIVNTNEQQKRNMLYIVLGSGTIYLFAGPFMQSVIQFSNALEIPFLFTSFVVAPFFMNTRSVIIFAFSPSRRNNSNKSASLAFFELYSGLVMNNLMGLTTLLVIVFIKDLTWDYTAEVVTIIMIGLIMGTFARTCKTYPLWTSALSFFLYIISISMFCVYAWARA